MADLVGHDRRPSAFIVYLYLLRQSSKARHPKLALSLQTIATKTGLSKSSVQVALRHLQRRRLIDSNAPSPTAEPLREILKPWLR
jgi:Helix-turn-helix domain